MDVNLQANGGFSPARTAPEPNLQAAQVAATAPPVREREVARPTPQVQATPQVAAPVTASRPESVSSEGVESPILREEDVSDYMIERAFSDANRALAGGQFRLSYGLHEGSNRVHIAIYDSNTNELIREIPSESRLDTYARITEFTGLLFDSSS